MREKTTVELLFERIKTRHPSPPKPTAEILFAIERRVEEGREPTEGQMKFLRAMARSMSVEWNGRPSAWTGKWLGSDW